MINVTSTIKHYKLKILKLTVFILLFLSSLQGFTQNEYTLFKYYEPFRPDSSAKLLFGIDNVNFFKNNEYKSDFATGYTLTGAWLRPKMVLYLDKKLRMELGGHVLKYNGRDEYYHLSPWFNIHYQPTEKISVILGNINSDFSHNLPEPIAESEMFLTSRPESGLQAIYNSTRFTVDFWIDWQQFIIKDDPFKERFAFGSVTNFKIFENNKTSFSLPVSFYGLHEGGEIDNAPGLAKTFISLTSGLSFMKKLSNKTFKNWSINTHYSVSTYPKDNITYKESNGWGIYANSTIDTKFGGLTLAYWLGHLFYTPQGGHIYQNLSVSGTELINKNVLLNLKYHYFKEIIPDTYFGFVFDYYYDIIKKKTMNSAGLYLVVNFGVSPCLTKPKY